MGGGEKREFRACRGVPRLIGDPTTTAPPTRNAPITRFLEMQSLRKDASPGPNPRRARHMGRFARRERGAQGRRMSRTAGLKNPLARTQKEVQADCKYLMMSLVNFPVYVEFKTRCVPPATAYVRTVVKITEADLNEHLKSPTQPSPQLNLDQTREAIITRALNLSGTALSETRPHFHSPSLIS